jgi:hypothetical protein
MMTDRNLSAELRNARALHGADPTINLEFVLRNNSKQPIELTRRWNSWGAYQWTLEVTDACGKKYHMANPMRNWARNFFATFVIAPKSEQVMTCKLLWGQLSQKDIESNAADEMTNLPKIFQCTDRVILLTYAARTVPKPESSWVYPITIVGKFSAQIQGMKDGKDIIRTNWSGTVETKPLVVKKP